MPRRYKKRVYKQKGRGIAKWRMEKMPSNEDLQRRLDKFFGGAGDGSFDSGQCDSLGGSDDVS